MYSSIASIHIALDSRLQILNSNRKQSIHPEEYDMAVNDAILTVLKQRFSPELNSKKQGLEESIKRYTDLSSLKRETLLDLYWDGKSQYFNIPSDCYLPISLNGIISYSRNIIKDTTDEDIQFNIITLNNSTITNNGIDIEFVDLTEDSILLNTIMLSTKSMFYALNYLKEYFKETYNIDAYIENYNNLYYPNSIILVIKNPDKVISSAAGASVSLIGSTLQKLTDDTIDPIKKHKKIDLVSSENYNDLDNDYYLSKNLHLNPIYKIVQNNGILKTSTNFIYEDITLEYIKHPRFVNSRLNRMTDMIITDEILDVACTNLSGILKDETYQLNKQKEQFNN